MCKKITLSLELDLYASHSLLGLLYFKYRATSVDVNLFFHHENFHELKSFTGHVVRSAAGAVFGWWQDPVKRLDVGFILTYLNDEEMVEFYNHMLEIIQRLQYEELEELRKLIKGDRRLERDIGSRITRYMETHFGLEEVF